MAEAPDTNNNQLAKSSGASDIAAQRDVIPQQLNLTKLNNLKQVTFLGNMMAQSGMFSDVARDPAKAIVKIIAGQEMGIPPVEAMRGLDIIQGQVAIGAGLMAAKIKSSEKYDFKVRQWDNTACIIEFFERSEETGKYETAGVSEFTLQDAATAGLSGKDMWRKYPRNMLFARAMSNGQTIYAPDIFQVGTVYTQEEMNDTIETPPSSPPAAPPAVLPAPKVDDTPANDSSDDPTESDVDSGKTVLQLIGEDLESKGFDKKLDRHKIALTIAGVKTVDAASEGRWGMVLDTITGMDYEQLEAILNPPPDDEPTEPEPPQAPEKSVEQAIADGDPEPPAGFLRKEDDAVPVSDEDLAKTQAETTAAEEKHKAEAATLLRPTYRKGSTNLARPEMRKDAKRFFDQLGISSQKDREEYTKVVIDKPNAATFDDFEKLIEQLYSDVIGLKESQQELVNE